MKNEVFWGIGVIVLGVAVYYFFNNKKDKKTVNNPIKKKDIKQDSVIDELIKNQCYVEDLTIEELLTWFKEHKNQVPDTAKMVIAIPDDRIIKGFDRVLNGQIEKTKTVIQLFYNDTEEKFYLNRLINYKNIDTNLQARLIEEDGMIVIDK